MKVITRTVIDMETLEVLEEEGYFYSGDVALCKGGGGGGSGSGRVDYPDYMKSIQSQWLRGTDHDTGPSSYLDDGNDITALMNAAINSNPYDGLSAYDPSDEISEMESALTNFDGIDLSTTDSISELDNLETYVDSLSTTDKVEDELSQFNAGMRDINAVVSSGFTVGQQIVASSMIETKARLKSDIRSKKSDVHLQENKLKLSKGQQLMQTKIEANRMMIVTKSEQTNTDRKIDTRVAEWPLEIFQYGANSLASISGGTIQKKGEEPSEVQSALGGALSGAAMGAATGAMSGTPFGMAAGAAIGGAVGIGSSLL